MRVICTAGHVDHGKSTLVEALSGIHPDRWEEERQREMTIDLGFAWTTLPDGEHIAIVDVPGHEDFIENMLAGIAGLDAFLLIIAADEGVMPQTLEHLSIIKLMGMADGVVALTKTDLAESDDWIDLVMLDIEELLLDYGWDNIPIVPVSAKKGQGIDELQTALSQVLAQHGERLDIGRPVLPIDRVFSISGFGTVVTGTLSDGHLAVGDTVEIQPANITARVRGLQSHDTAIQQAPPGSRVAVNLTGVDKSDLKRGDVLTLPKLVTPTTLLDVVYDHLPHAKRRLKHNAQVKVFVGPSESLARVRLLDADSIAPAERGYVQLQLDDPLAILPDSRFVLRIPSPSETIGGGVVLDTAPGRKWKRNRAEVIQRFEILASDDELAKISYRLYQTRAPQPLAWLPDSALLDELQAEFGVLKIADWLIHPEFLRETAARIENALHKFHDDNPAAIGMPKEQFLSLLQIEGGAEVFTKRLIYEKMLQRDGDFLKIPGRGLSFSKAEREKIDDLLDRFQKKPFEPPSYKESAQLLGSEKLIKILLSQGHLRIVPPDVLLLPEPYEQLLMFSRGKLEAGAVLTVGDLRDHFQTTRRIALPFLDYLERQGITRRDDDGHRLANHNWDSVR